MQTVLPVQLIASDEFFSHDLIEKQWPTRRPESHAVMRLMIMAADEDENEDRPPPGSPPSIVYDSRRGEHQFELEFSFSSRDDEDSFTPVLLARELLLFDT